LSTIDWRGRAVCTVFFRGCPIHCSYCQNEGILEGADIRNLSEIQVLIKSSAPYISGVVFSGGEPTMQKEALIELARYTKALDLQVGLQTNGFFPETIERLLEEHLLDKVALDFKSRFEGYSGEPGKNNLHFQNYEKNARKTFRICKTAYAKDILKEFEVVLTVFYENENYIEEISAMIGKIPLVLQQGEHKVLRLRDLPPNMSEGEYRERKRKLQESYHPLTLDEIKRIADRLGRKVRIRTRDVGEIIYKSGAGS
jgi:pyruvate formate lyase activating enzyme